MPSKGDDSGSTESEDLGSDEDMSFHGTSEEVSGSDDEADLSPSSSSRGGGGGGRRERRRLTSGRGPTSTTRRKRVMRRPPNIDAMDMAGEDDASESPASGYHPIRYEDKYCLDRDLLKAPAPDDADQDDRNVDDEKGDSDPPSSPPPLPVDPKARARLLFKGMHTSMCQYAVVRRCCRALGMREVEEDKKWSLFWADGAVHHGRVATLKSWQIINHFPDMAEICRKDLLARNVSRMQEQFPTDFAFLPQTWEMPYDWGKLMTYMREHGNRRGDTFIVKPRSGSQGFGIFLTKNPAKMDKSASSVCQIYLERPLRIDGFKFDLRLYVLVTSCSPLRIFRFDDGLVRFATIKYAPPNASNLGSLKQHLTNYSINKDSEEFDDDAAAGAGSKRKMSWLWKYLEKVGDVGKLKKEIDDLVIKTLISAVGVLGHSYRACTSFTRKHSACFEILGFDIMLDEALRPWLIEVNHAPSFRCDSKLDRDVKERVVNGAMQIVSLNIAEGPPSAGIIPAVKPAARPASLSLEEKQKLKVKKDRAARRKKKEDLRNLALLEDEACEGTGYSRMYPQANEDEYAVWYKAANRGPKKYEMTAAAKAAVKASKEIRDGVDKKQKDREKMRNRKKKKKKQQQQQQQQQTAVVAAAATSVSVGATQGASDIDAVVSAAAASAAGANAPAPTSDIVSDAVGVIETIIPPQNSGPPLAAAPAAHAAPQPAAAAGVAAEEAAASTGQVAPVPAHQTSSRSFADVTASSAAARSLPSHSHPPTAATAPAAAAPLPRPHAHVVLPGDGLGSVASVASIHVATAGDRLVRESPQKLKPLLAPMPTSPHGSPIATPRHAALHTPRQRTARIPSQQQQPSQNSNGVDSDRSAAGTPPDHNQQRAQPPVRAWAGEILLDQCQQQQQPPQQQHRHAPPATHRHRTMHHKDYLHHQQQYFEQKQQQPQHEQQRIKMRKTPAMNASALARALQRRTCQTHAFSHQPNAGSGGGGGGLPNSGGVGGAPMRITGMLQPSSKLYSNVVSGRGSYGLGGNHGGPNANHAHIHAPSRADLSVASHHRYSAGAGACSGDGSFICYDDERAVNSDYNDQKSTLSCTVPLEQQQQQHHPRHSRHSPAMASTFGVSGSWEQWKAGLAAAGSQSNGYNGAVVGSSTATAPLHSSATASTINVGHQVIAGSSDNGNGGVAGGGTLTDGGRRSVGGGGGVGGRKLGAKLERRHEGLAPNRASLLRHRAAAERSRYTVVMPPRRDRRFGGLGGSQVDTSRQYGVGSRYHGGVGATAAAGGRYR